MAIFKVDSFTASRDGIVYDVEVAPNGKASKCTCPHFRIRRPRTCKHFAAAEEMHTASKAVYIRIQKVLQKEGLSGKLLSTYFKKWERAEGFTAAFAHVAKLDEALTKGTTEGVGAVRAFKDLVALDLWPLLEDI